MEAITLLIAVGALVMATASLAVQVTLHVTSKNKKQPLEQPKDTALDQPSEKEIEAFFASKPISKDDKRLEEVFSDPEPYSGIDGNFDI